MTSCKRCTMFTRYFWPWCTGSLSRCIIQLLLSFGWQKATLTFILGTFINMGIYFPFAEGKWSRSRGTKGSSNHGCCSDVGKLCTIYNPEQSSGTIQVLFVLSKNHLSTVLQITKVLFDKLLSWSSCLFKDFCMVDSWTEILASSSDVFKTLGVTCGLFFISLRILCFLWPHLCSVSTELNRLWAVCLTMHSQMP